tara:strand:+ start:927 stop:1118 length:192 start_codon:yes stop_codon:yes gene_type:complete
MELFTNEIVFLILMGFMPFMALCIAILTLFNLNTDNSRTILKVFKFGILLTLPGLIILISLIN